MFFVEIVVIYGCGQFGPNGYKAPQGNRQEGVSPMKNVKKVVVAGGGVLGTQIALQSALSGFVV